LNPGASGLWETTMHFVIAGLHPAIHEAKQPHGLDFWTFIMDCRVDPGNDRLRVREQTR
jgi:hypothetical protein